MSSLLLHVMQGNVIAQVAISPAKPDTLSATKNADSSSASTIFDLLSFTGSAGNGQNVLSWKTDSRSHFTDFTLERSINETEFTAIGHVELSGTAKTNSFTYADNKPVTGRNFYRLKMADSAGKSTYSPIISLTHIPSNNLQVHFDAPSGTVGLTGIESGNPYQLKIYNCNGQLSLQKTVTADAPTISISQLPHGLYVVYATDGTAIPVSRKIIW